MSDTTDTTENKREADRAFLFLIDPVNGEHHGQFYDQVPDGNMDACSILDNGYKDDRETCFVKNMTAESKLIYEWINGTTEMFAKNKESITFGSSHIHTFYITDLKVSDWNDAPEVIDCTKAGERDYVVINASAAPRDHKKSTSMNLYSDKTIILEELKYVNSRNNMMIFAVAAAAATFAIIAKVILSKSEYKNLIKLIHSDADTGTIAVTGKMNQDSMMDFGCDAGSKWVPTKWWTC